TLIVVAAPQSGNPVLYQLSIHQRFSRERSSHPLPEVHGPVARRRRQPRFARTHLSIDRVEHDGVVGRAIYPHTNNILLGEANAVGDDLARPSITTVPVRSHPVN